MAKNHINIPVFIPHLGCPNQCVFCNQRTISGVSEFDPLSVVSIIEEALSTKRDDQSAEIAFFGGSFTGIDPVLMEKLLNIANGYLKQGRISSIRCSTRPDYISEQILDLLMQYEVGTVELGLQSSCDKVLELTKRGHDMQAEIRACELIKKKGIRLGGQMMVGLPGATPETDRETARFMVEVGCDEARIYPTVVFRDTELSCMLESEAYSALTLEEAVKRSTDAFEILARGGVKILRIGLCDSENLHSSETYLAGPNHPAIGELVEGEYYYRTIERLIEESRENISDKITLTVPCGHTSKVAGHNRKNKIRLAEKYGIKRIKIVESDTVSDYSVSLSAEGRK